MGWIIVLCSSPNNSTNSVRFRFISRELLRVARMRSSLCERDLRRTYAFLWHVRCSISIRMDDEGIAMLSNKRNQDAPEKCAPAASVEDALARLSNEDSKLGERMLNAAVAGAVVARQPADLILRAEAAEAWNSIRPVIARHLTCEEDIVLPWAK